MTAAPPLGPERPTGTRSAVTRSRSDPARLATVTATLAFFVIVLRRLWHQHVRFGDHVFDMGIFDQGLWLLSRFHDPFVTLRGLNLFADHSSYVMVLFAPLYWIWADARMLLIVTVASLAAGAPLVHAVARRHGLSPWVAAGLAGGYLLNPVVLWQAWEDFHPEIIAAPCILGAYLLAGSRRRWFALIPIVLMLLAKEDAAFVVVPLGILFAFRSQTRRLGFAAAGLGVAMFVLNFFVLLPHFSPSGELIYTNRYGDFGDSFGEIVTNAVTDPGLVFETLVTQESVVYLAWTILPLFLAVLAPEILAVGVPITLLNLMSSFPYQHEARRHYTVYFITIVALAAVVGAGRLAHWLGDQRLGDQRLGDQRLGDQRLGDQRLGDQRVRGRRRGTRFVPGAAVAAMVAAALISQTIIGPNESQGVGWGGRVAAGDVDEVERALAIIPSDAVLAADSPIAARMAHRRVVYRLPMPWTRLDWGAGELPPVPPVTTVEWVAVLATSLPGNPWLTETIDEIRLDDDYVVRHEDDLVIIFERR